jgi:hypothetical protein
MMTICALIEASRCHQGASGLRGDSRRITKPGHGRLREAWSQPRAHGCLESGGLRWLNGVFATIWGVVLLWTLAAVSHWLGALMSRDGLRPVPGDQPAGPSDSAANGRFVPAVGQPGHGELTASLRRQRVPPGRLEDGYTGAFEIICGDCGDYPDRGYSQVPPRLQRLRGPYNTIKAGLAAYKEHLGLAN